MGFSNLTPKQKEVLDFICSYMDQLGYPPSLKELALHFKKSIPTMHQFIETLKSKGYLKKESNVSRGITTTDEGLEVFLLGRIAAGAPIEPLENPTPIEVPDFLIKTPGNYYALEVKGNSMVEDGILNKDLILIKHQNTANIGETIVAIINQEATLKRFGGLKDGKAKLIPKNPDLQPFYVDALDFEIRGKYIGLIRRHSESSEQAS